MEVLRIITTEDHIFSSDGRVYSKKCKKYLTGKTSDGYYHMSIDGKTQLVSRVIYELFVGPISEGFDIDHVNSDRADNRIENLQMLTHAQNAAKRLMTKRNTSGIVGVCWHKQKNKWQAQIKINNKQIYLGSFKDLEDARAARNNYIDTHPNCEHYTRS